MKLLTTKKLLLILSCFALFLFTGSAYASSADSETPVIVKECKDLSQTDSEAFTTRFHDLSQDKRALLNGMILEAYGKKKLPYQKEHLEIMFKSVEYYSVEKTRSHLQTLYRAAGN